MLTFSDEYFEPEVRDGFYVPGMMKRFWASQLEVLAEIDRICRKHKIQYFAEWGTLLGAVRHHGFIPWDDDLDIAMKREDYMRFLAIAPDELQNGCSLLDYNTSDDYWDFMARVITSESLTFSKEFLDTYHNSPYVSGVDIFPMDYFPRDPEQQNFLKDIITMIKTVADTSPEGLIPPEELSLLLGQIETFTGRTIDRSKLLQRELYELLTVIQAMYTSDESDNLAIIGLWVEHDNTGYAKELYRDVIYVPFENIEIPVPVGYHTILSRKYGNYMNLVKNGGNSTHDYPLYKVQNEFLVEHANAHFDKFTYHNQLLAFSRDKNARKSLKADSLAIMSLFIEATASIKNSLLGGDFNSSLDLLAQCQENIIQLGTQIENVIGTDCAVIKEIENYCELIFQVYEAINTDSAINPSAVCTILQEQLHIISNSITDNLQVPRIIVFLPFRADTWNAMEALWEQEKNTPNTEVYVIPIPYFYRDYFGCFQNGVFQGDRLPEYLHPIDFNSVDLQQLHPDTIYIQNPYDEYADTISIHPDFYAQNIVKYTDELIYVPYFITDEIDWTNPRETDIMDEYVTMPGVVYADKVIVQSEQMRDSYIRKLTEWAGEETRSIWENKIVGTGHPLMQPKQKTPPVVIPEEWRSYLYDDIGEQKKILLYSVSVSTLIENKATMLSKIKRCLHTFKEHNQQVALIFRPQNKLIDNLRRLNPTLCKKYLAIVREYQKENWGIYDDAPDETLALSLCDAYYGDGGEVAQKAVMLKKPVMIQNVEC